MQIIIDKNQLNLYNDILDFLEDIYIQKGPYEYNDSLEERRTDVILPTFGINFWASNIFPPVARASERYQLIREYNWEFGKSACYQ